MLEFILGGVVIYFLMRPPKRSIFTFTDLRVKEELSFNSRLLEEKRRFPHQVVRPGVDGFEGSIWVADHPDECVYGVHRFPYLGNGKFGETCTRCGLTQHGSSVTGEPIYYTNSDGKRGTPKELLS